MARNGKPSRDVFKEVTDSIVAALEAGVAPWVRPWRSLGASGDLRNGASGRAYSGINVLLLAIASDANGYADPRWVTFKQAKDLGGHVRRGERGTLIVFWKPVRVRETDPEGGDRMKVIPILRHHTVFSIEQCAGLNLPDRVLDETPAPELDAACEDFLARTGADIRHGGARAFYRHRPADYIQLPDPRAFPDAGAYYSTAFHELTHWTGDEDRSPRTKGKRFGDEDYAREELVAELGAAFLCRRFRVDGTLQHTEYIGTWLEALKRDKRAIFSAASAARKACEYLYGVAGLEAAGDAPEGSSEPQGAAA